MGLDTTHDCWHGAYTAFHRWRTAVACVIGLKLDEMDGFVERGLPCVGWDSVLHNGEPDPLCKLLHHSDCDGDIAVEDLLPIAARLDEIRPLLQQYDAQHPPAGHMGHGTAARARQFADGLRLAHSRGEAVEFR